MSLRERCRVRHLGDNLGDSLEKPLLSHHVPALWSPNITRTTLPLQDLRRLGRQS